MTATVFPAAAQPADDRHPADCACAACTNALLADLRRPLVQPAARMDRALESAPPKRKVRRTVRGEVRPANRTKES